jgi:hypothetical protein
MAQWTKRWIKSVADASWQKTSAEVAALLRDAGFTRIEARSVCYWIKTFAILAE